MQEPTRPGSREGRSGWEAALRNCGFDYPSYQTVTVNLAPADIGKEGSAFDLPMALGLVGCQGAFFGKLLDSYVFLGELSLDGSVRSVRGAGCSRTRHKKSRRAGCERAGSGSRGGNARLWNQVAAASGGPDECAGVVPAPRGRCFADAGGSEPICG